MLLWALACGAVLGALYDLIAVARGSRGELPPILVQLRKKLTLPPALRLPKKEKSLSENKRKREWIGVVLLFWQDVLLCLFFAIVAVLLLYYTNDGQWRTGVIALMLFSFFGYRATVGRPMRLVLLFFRTALSLLLSWIAAILIYPVRLLWQLSEKPRLWLMSCVLRLYRRLLASVDAQRRKREKRRRKSEKNASQNVAQSPMKTRRPPDGKTVFSRGGYHR